MTVVYQGTYIAGTGSDHGKGDVIGCYLIVVSVFIDLHVVRPRGEGVHAAEPVNSRKQVAPAIVVVVDLIQSTVI